MSIGWIKLHRGLTEWEWYDDINTSRLFIHCLLKANHKDKKWRGLDIKRGSFWTSLDTLSEETGLSKKCVRTSLDRLKATCELADKGHSTGRLRGRMVTVCKYDSYQAEGIQEAHEGADKGQTEGTQRAATKNDKNVENEIKEINTPAKPTYNAEDIQMAEWMLNVLLIDQPSIKKPSIESWAKTIRLMRERDGRNYQAMGAVWKWARQDNFWASNILSASKFREKYDTLQAQSTRPANSTGYMTANEKAAARAASTEKLDSEADLEF